MSYATYEKLEPVAIWLGRAAVVVGAALTFALAVML